MLNGEIYKINLGGGIGCEQGGERPCVIVQNDCGNRFSPTTIIVPLTSQEKLKQKNMPVHWAIIPDDINNLSEPSIALCEQVRVIDKTRVISYIGQLKTQDVLKIKRCLKKSLNIKI